MRSILGIDAILAPAKLPTTVEPLPTVSSVKTATLSLAEDAIASVTAVRQAFASGTPPLQTVGSGSADSYISRLGRTDIGDKIARSTSRFGVKTSTAGSSVPPPRPELDSADVVEGLGGILDQFSVKLTVSLKAEQVSSVRFIKIMRAKLGPVPNAPRPSFSALMASPEMPGSKGFDRLAAAAFRAADAGIGNKLTDFIGDTLAGRGVSSPDGSALRTTLPPVNTNRTGDGFGLLELAGADRSVVENLSFYLNRRANDAIKTPSVDSVSVINRFGINVLAGSSVAASAGTIVQGSNALQFSEIGRIGIGTQMRAVGNFFETEFLDRSVVYGAGFAYYISCIGQDGAEGPRSKIVSASVIRTVPPEVPKVTFSLISGYPRFAIRCAPGTDHVEIFRSGRQVVSSIKLATENTLVADGPALKVGQYWHLEDAGLGPDGSTTFVDDEAVSGDKLNYRIYSVDSYGFKCQTPFSCSIKMPEHGRPNPIPVPSVTVERGTGQPNMLLRMRVDDPRVVGFTVQRRDVTIAERSVHQANQPEWNDLGLRDAKRAGSRRGPSLKDADWPIYIPASAGSASFVDTAVRLDRVYQYAIGAIDSRGNKTLLVGSQPVGIYSKPVIDPPTALAANVVVDGNKPRGVLLTWSPGTNDIDPNAIVGDQDVLAATAVRSAFQVERRQIGAPFWDALPATSESYFIDIVSSDPTPAFRPAYVVPGGEYEYRVMAMQSGGFISPRTDTVPIAVIPPPLTPNQVFTRSSHIEVSPLTIVVSWNMSSEFVERWEIERAVTNSIFGKQISSMDSREARGLSYTRVADITPESSRARGISSDELKRERSVYVGNRFYVDSDVHLANSYFYRVRTVGRVGVTSDWAYSGIYLRDDAFHRKFQSLLSDEKKTGLTLDSRPILVPMLKGGRRL